MRLPYKRIFRKLHIFHQKGQNGFMEVGILNLQHQDKTCVICEEKKGKGIHLYTSFICSECENDLIKTETYDPKYKFYLDQLKKAHKPGIFS